jgi:hypothetical protein
MKTIIPLAKLWVTRTKRSCYMVYSDHYSYLFKKSHPITDKWQATRQSNWTPSNFSKLDRRSWDCDCTSWWNDREFHEKVGSYMLPGTSLSLSRERALSL